MHGRARGSNWTAVQRGEQPEDFKPMPAIGPGAEELRAWSEAGTFRVIYFARTAEAVNVLHAFQKKTQRTAWADIELTRERCARLKRTAP